MRTWFALLALLLTTGALAGPAVAGDPARAEVVFYVH